MPRFAALTLVGALGVLAAGCCDDIACTGPLTIHVDRAAVPPGGDLRIYANGTPLDCSDENSSHDATCWSVERFGSRTFHVSFRPKDVVIERVDANGDIVDAIERQPKYNDRSGKNSCSENCDRRATVTIE